LLSRFGKKSNVTIVSEAGDLRTHDKVNLDIFWLKDDSLEESANLPAPEVIDQEITDDPESALEQFATIAEDLKK
jgi:type I restriction enzyme M protein